MPTVPALSALPASPVSLAGHGLLLREWAEEDLPVMAELLDDPQTRRFTPLPVPFDLEAARGYLAGIEQARAEAQQLHLAVTVDGRAAGEVLLALDPDRDRGRVFIGYVLGAPWRGRGLAVRSVRLLTDYAHRTLGVPRLTAQIDPANTASAAVAGRAGYHRLDGTETVRKDDRTFTLHSWVHDSGTDGTAAAAAPPA